MDVPMVLLIGMFVVSYIVVRDRSRRGDEADASRRMAEQVVADDSPLDPIMAAQLGVPGLRFGVWIPLDAGGRMFVAAYGTPEEAATAASAARATLLLVAKTR